MAGWGCELYIPAVSQILRWTCCPSTATVFSFSPITVDIRSRNWLWTYRTSRLVLPTATAPIRITCSNTHNSCSLTLTLYSLVEPSRASVRFRAILAAKCNRLMPPPLLLRQQTSRFSSSGQILRCSGKASFADFRELRHVNFEDYIIPRYVILSHRKEKWPPGWFTCWFLCSWPSEGERAGARARGRTSPAKPRRAAELRESLLD